MKFDLVITNGVVVDGSGVPRFRGDAGVRDGMIAAVGTLGTYEAVTGVVAVDPDGATGSRSGRVLRGADLS